MKQFSKISSKRPEIQRNYVFLHLAVYCLSETKRLWSQTIFFIKKNNIGIPRTILQMKKKRWHDIGKISKKNFKCENGPILQKCNGKKKGGGGPSTISAKMVF